MNIGFIGLGMMGEPMARRLLHAGNRVYVFNRSEEKARDLIREGGKWCTWPGEVASRVEIIFTMLSTSDVVKELALGERGILAGLNAGGIHIDCSTIAPATTKKLATEYGARGREFLHSPVLGSIPQATDGSLLLFVGGDQIAFAKAEPALRILGSNIWRFERVEQASNMKLTCNFFIAGMITMLAQALVFLKHAGIEQKLFLEILSHSALNAPMFQTKGTTMIAANFAPRFFVEHMLKDVRLFLDSSANQNTQMPTAELAYELFSKAVKMGFANEDYSAVVKVL